MAERSWDFLEQPWLEVKVYMEQSGDGGCCQEVVGRKTQIIIRSPGWDQKGICVRKPKELGWCSGWGISLGRKYLRRGE